MSRLVDVRVPDMGTYCDVPIIDVLVKPGDPIARDGSLITLETEKATMDVPSDVEGVIEKLHVGRGGKVSAGDIVATVRVDGSTVADAPALPEGSAAAALPAESVAPGNGAATNVVSSPQPQARESAGTASLAMPMTHVPGTNERRDPEARSSSSPKGSPTLGAQTAAPEDIASADRKTQLVVLGSGPGGYTAAFRAADLGLDVTLIERYPTLGGICLNVGCIPSKALLHAAKVIDEAQSMAAHGVSFGKPAIDLNALRNWKQSVVRKLTGGLALLARQRKVNVITGYGTFVSPHVIEVTKGDGTVERIAFEQCIIAAGSQAIKLPGFPDDPRILDSTGALELPADTKRLLVIGGGIIGLEMATVYEALGVNVSVVELTPNLMPGADPDLVKPLEKRLRARYEAILLGVKVTKAEALPEGIRVTFEGPNAPEPQLYDRVLVAVGRTPNGKRIGAEAAGVEVTDRGFIPAYKQLRTNVPHIFAIGDIIGQPMLAHKAMHEAKVAAEVAAGDKHSFDVRAIPSVAYTDPEVAWTGLTEIQAQANNISYKKGSFPWLASGRSASLGRDEGLTKILFDPESHRVLGAGIVGPNAGELIAELTLAIEMGADAADVSLTVHPHPTLSETAGLSAEAFEGTLTELYIRKR